VTDTPSLPSVRDDWRVVSGGLLRGLSHDLNGRVTALHAVALALEDGDIEHASALLVDEAGRLETLARRLESLSHTYDDAEAVELGTLVEDALALARLDRELAPLELACHVGDVPSAQVPRAVFLRLFLAILTGLGRSARRSGADAVQVQCETEDTDVLLVAAVSDVAGDAHAAVHGFADAPVFGVLAAVATAIHGALAAHTDDDPRVELRVPSINAPKRAPLDI